MVDQLYPQIGCEVNAQARKEWPAFTAKNKNKTVLELLLQLATESNKAIKPMLAIDKDSKRDNLIKMRICTGP